MVSKIRKMLKKKYEYMRIKGTITPSSNYTVNKIIKKIDFTKNIKILQLGFGTGVFSKGIIKKLNKDSRLLIFEIDRICDKYYDSMQDKRINYIKDSAENVSKYFPDEKFDYILSTLPFAIIPKKIKENIFKEIKIHLEQNGKFLQYQYSLISKKDIGNLFNIPPKIDFSLFNIPPAFIYEVQNKLK